jgi:hypothetical protein
MGAKNNTHGLLVGNPEEKRLLGSPRCRRVGNVKTDLEIGLDGMDWTDLPRGRDQLRALVNMVMNVQVP